MAGLLGEVPSGRGAAWALCAFAQWLQSVLLIWRAPRFGAALLSQQTNSGRAGARPSTKVRAKPTYLISCPLRRGDLMRDMLQPPFSGGLP